jgi:RHS repeat-associated protein
MAKAEHTSPPAGTGHVPGLGESFSINLSTGQGTYAYKIPLPDGVAGHTPKLALEYTHGAGHGAFGQGWRFSLRSMALRLDFGPPDDGLVERFHDGGAEVGPAEPGVFRALRETVFSRYTRHGEGWRIEERDGHVHELGLSATTRVAHPDHPERIVEWLIERTTDACGNAIAYTYRFDDGMAYPDTIRYAIYELRFVYERRPDVRHDGRAGFSRRRALRCATLQLVLDPGPGERVIRSYELVYTLAPGSGVSLLSELRLTAHGETGDVRRPTVRFAYSSFDPAQFRARWMTSEATPPPGLDEAEVALVTLDDAPLPGILLNRDGRTYYWANRGGGSWAPPRPLAKTPFVSSFGRAGLAFVDMDGSGTADLMVADADRLQGYYENGGRGGWSTFVPFPRGRRAGPAWAERGLRLADADSDGLIDALLSQRRAFVWWRNEGRDGWSAPALVPKSSDDVLSVDLADPDVHLADMTGDGSPDLVRVRSGSVEYWPSLGRGRFGARVIMQGSPRLRRDESDTLLLVDLDGDGCADLVHVAANRLTIYQNDNGARLAGPVSIDGIPAPMPGTVRAASLSGRAGAGLVWNSLVRQERRYVLVERETPVPPYLLTRVENGSGLTSEIVYRSAVEDYRRDRDRGARWTTNFPFPYLVVGGTRETDAVSGRLTEVEFRYHEAHFERRDRRFEGFRSAERIEHGDASRPHTRVLHVFLMAQERQPGRGREHAHLNGLLSRMETYALDGSPAEDRPYRVETSEYGLTLLGTTADGRPRSFVFLAEHRSEHTERADGPAADVRVERKTYAYDANGSVIRERLTGSGTLGGVAQPSRERVTEVQYAVSATRYLVDRPARVSVRDGDGGLLVEKRSYYDGPDFVGLPLGQVDRGLVSREEEWTLTQAEFDDHYAGMDAAALGFTSGTNADGVPSVFAPSRRNRHDARGLVVATLDALGGESRVVHDASGLFRVALADPLGETRFVYDRATRQIVQITFADGTVTRMAYDAQGRVLRSALPGQDLADAPTTYAYDETTVPHRRIARFRQAGGRTSVGVTYYDGGGKEFQHRVEVDPGRVVVSGHRRPNPWGDLTEEFEPTFAAGTEFAMPDVAGRPSRRFFYDGCGRVVRSINYNGGVSTARYRAFSVVAHDANDNDDSPEGLARGHFDTPHEEAFDVLRNLVRVTERPATDREVVTTYEIGPMGELAAIADGQGTKFRYRYDRRGTRLAIAIRESGERLIWYDARKKPVRTLDPAGHEIRASFDTVGRLASLATPSQTLEEYVYDTPAQHAFGRLAEVRYPGGGQAFTYDIAGRLVERAYTFDGETAPRRLRYERDVLGRETVIVHDDGTRIERELTFNGWVKAIAGVVQRIEHDPRSFPTEILYASGVRTTYAYTPGPGRISRQITTSPDGEVFEDVALGYDRMDLLLSRNDTAPGGVGLRELAYDPLGQLTGVTTTKNGTVDERRYEYAPDYNLRRFDEARMTLHYDDASHPDRLSGLTPDGEGLFPVPYDGNGNLLALPGQQFAYNAKNELVRFTNDDGVVAEYRYDHLGLRVEKRVDDGQGHQTRILYLGDQAEIRDGVPAYFVCLGLARVAVLTGGTVRVLHESGLGSTGFVTDAGGQRVGRIDYHPFGNPATRDGDVSFRTFALHPVDEESGLVYMRRRYYAPTLGRFLTPDLMAIYQPEKFLHAPHGLHLYAFVANDPANKADALGLSFWTVIGGIVGVAAGIAVGLALLPALAGLVGVFGVLGVIMAIGLVLAVDLGVVLVSYLIAANVDPNSAFGEAMRGFLVGFNAGMNGVLAGAIFCPTVGVILGIINFLAVFETLAHNPVYQGVLGWSSWAMPMSWLITGLGVAVFAFQFLAAVFSFQPAARIESISIDWRTGTVVMQGGLIENGSAWNMGNFVFVDPDYLVPGDPERSYEALIAHETGHTLEVGAFGSVFLLVDFFNALVLGAEYNSYGEQIAESHANRGGGYPAIPMWG